jgi:hypothetical protein
MAKPSLMDALSVGPTTPKEAGMDSGGGDMEACCSDLIDAVKSGDAKACADAFRACFAACEMEPHDEADE